MNQNFADYQQNMQNSIHSFN